MRLAIYLDEDGIPGDLLVDGGTGVAIDAGAPAFKSQTLSQYMAQGWYWMAFHAQSGTYRISTSGSHPGLFTSRQDESSTANNPLGFTFLVDAILATLWRVDGWLARLRDIGRPTHANIPRMMIGI